MQRLYRLLEEVQPGHRSAHYYVADRQFSSDQSSIGESREEFKK